MRAFDREEAKPFPVPRIAGDWIIQSRCSCTDSAVPSRDTSHEKILNQLPLQSKAEKWVKLTSAHIRLELPTEVYQLLYDYKDGHFS